MISVFVRFKKFSYEYRFFVLVIGKDELWCNIIWCDRVWDNGIMVYWLFVILINC